MNVRALLISIAVQLHALFSLTAYSFYPLHCLLSSRKHTSYSFCLFIFIGRIKLLSALSNSPLLR